MLVRPCLLSHPACRSWIRVKVTKTQKAHFFGQPWVAKEGMEEKAQKESKSTRAQRAACAPARHWHTVDILRPYHSEDGSVFVKRAGASRDGDLLSPEGLAQRVNATNSELINRPAKGVTMLAGPYSTVSRRSGSPQTPGKKRPEPSGSARESAAGRKAPSRGAAYSDKCRTDPGSGALGSLSDPDSVDTWRRTTILGAHLYVTGQQVLQVPGTRLFLSKWIQIHHEKYCSSGRTLNYPRPKDWKLLAFRLSSL